MSGKDPNPNYVHEPPKRDVLDGKPVVWLDAVSLFALIRLPEQLAKVPRSKR